MTENSSNRAVPILGKKPYQPGAQKKGSVVCKTRTPEDGFGLPFDFLSTHAKRGAPSLQKDKPPTRDSQHRNHTG